MREQRPVTKVKRSELCENSDQINVSSMNLLRTGTNQ